MKHTGCLLGAVLLLSSCAPTYLISTLESVNENTLKDKKGCFVTSNDSIDVMYSFKGDNGPILISVYNKGKAPLYIDWQRSTIIINDIATSYTGKTMMLTGSANVNTTGSSFYANSSQSSVAFNGTINKEQESLSFIPPNSKVEYKTLNLSALNFSQIDNGAYGERTNLDKDGNITPTKVATFEKSNAPIRFRSYLTLYKDPQKPFAIEQEFYVANIIKTNRITPSNMSNFFTPSGDVFYTKSSK